MVKAKGFTLLELMVVVVILGILGAIALPNLNSYMDSRRTTKAAEDIYSQLVYARSEAIARSTDVVARLGVVNSTTWALGISDDVNCNPALTSSTAVNACVLEVSGNKVLKRIASSDHPKVELIAPGAGIYTITFNPTRGTATGNGTISVNLVGGAPQGQLDIKIALIGRVKVCSPVGGTRYSKC